MTDTTPAPSRTQALAAFVTTLEPADIPARVRERAADLLVDHLAVSLAGLRLPWSEIIAAHVAAQGSTGRAMVYGRDRVAAPLAALANGTIAHGIELDDTHEPSVSHPGAVVFASVLAVGQELGATGEAILTAVVAAYEAMGRIGASADPGLIGRGFHPTALHGAFGACAGAARLMGLDAGQLDMAWGIATSLCSGSMAFTEDPLGTMVKRLHAGWPAHGGVVAASLARGGFTGPRRTLDAAKGYLATYSPGARREALTEALGERWVIDETSIKPYACCRLFHAAIDAVEACRREGVTAQDVASVAVLGPRAMVDGHLEYRPASVMSAQYSLPWSIAVALSADARDPACFAEARLADASTAALADRVRGAVDPALESLFPRKYAGAVAIRLRDGREVSRRVLDPSGSVESPLDRAAIARKFRSLTAGVLAPGAQDALLDAAQRFGELDDVAPFFSRLGAAGLG